MAPQEYNERFLESGKFKDFNENIGGTIGIQPTLFVSSRQAVLNLLCRWSRSSLSGEVTEWWCLLLCASRIEEHYSIGFCHNENLKHRSEMQYIVSVFVPMHG